LRSFLWICAGLGIIVRTSCGGCLIPRFGNSPPTRGLSCKPFRAINFKVLQLKRQTTQEVSWFQQTHPQSPLSCVAYYLPAADAWRQRSENKGEMGRQIVHWRNTLEKQWDSMRFGEVKLKTENHRHLFAVEVQLGGIDPANVAVELYAEGINGTDPIWQEMTRARSLAEEEGGSIYTGKVPSSRPASDYTARIIPRFFGAAVPLEITKVLWQR